MKNNDPNRLKTQYITLTLVMAAMDFKVKYDSSVLGYFWSLLKPLLMFGTLYLVFSVFTRWDVENYHLYLLLGIVLWNFLAEVTLNSMVLLESKALILKKVYFPRWIVVVASSLTSLLSLCLNLLVFGIFFFVSGARLTPQAVLLLPYLAELYLLSVGLAFLLCALYPKFRDVHHIWEVLVQLGFWLTPVVYPISLVPQRYQAFIFLNPMARIIQGTRQAVVGPAGTFMHWPSHLLVGVIAAVLFGAGWHLYNRFSGHFAEVL